MDRQVGARFLLPFFAILTILPFFLIPVLNNWHDSLPTCVSYGEFCLMVLPPSTRALWGLIDMAKITIYLGALVGFFYTIGKALE